MNGPDIFDAAWALPACQMCDEPVSDTQARTCAACESLDHDAAVIEWGQPCPRRSRGENCVDCNQPGVGDVIALFAEDGTEANALITAVQDNGSMVIQMPDGDTYQVRISPEEGQA